MISKSIHSIGIITIIVLMFIIYTKNINEDTLRISDPGTYLVVAYNLANYQHFGKHVGNDGQLLDKGFYFQEPGHPVFLGLILKLSKHFKDVSLPCFDSRSESNDCINLSESLKATKLRLLVNRVNYILICLIVILVIISAKLISNSWVISYISGVFIIFYLPNLDQDILRALLLILHSLTAYLSFRESKGKYAYGSISGVSLGLLTLNSPPYLYYIYFIIMIIIIVNLMKYIKLIKFNIKPIVLIGISSLLIVTPWMFRNYINGNQFTISGRGGINLALRMEYFTHQYKSFGEYLNFLPQPLKWGVHKILPFKRDIISNQTKIIKARAIALNRGLIKDDLLNDESDIMYRTDLKFEDYPKSIKKSRSLIIDNKLDNLDHPFINMRIRQETDKLMIKGSLSILKENLFKNIFVFTPLFAVRGSQFQLNWVFRKNSPFERKVAMDETELRKDIISNDEYLEGYYKNRKPLINNSFFNNNTRLNSNINPKKSLFNGISFINIIGLPFYIFYPFLLPSLIFCFIYSVIKKHLYFIIFIFPALFSHLFYSFSLIYLIRYNQQFSPISVICLCFSIIVTIKYFISLLKNKLNTKILAMD